MSLFSSENSRKPTDGWQRLYWLTAALMAVAVAIVVSNRLDLVIGDLLVMQNQKSIQPAEQEIVIVVITEETLAQFPYRSPIDRGFLADLIGALDAKAPKRIGLDILLDSPSDPEKDQKLFEAIDGAGAPIVLASAGAGNGLTSSQLTYLEGVLNDRLSGSIVLESDTIDGAVRHIPTILDNASRPVPLFTEILAGNRVSNQARPGRILYKSVADDSPSAFPKYPAHTVNLLPDEWFSGKIVLIGTDIPFSDRHLPPLGVANASLPGVEVHAHILHQILTGRSLPTLNWFLRGIFIGLAAVLSIAAVVRISRPRFIFFGLILATGLYVLIGYFLLAADVLLLPLAGPPIAVFSAALLASLLRWWQDRSERQFLETAFSQYVSKSVVRQLTSGKIKLSLGGEKRKVAYLFTDLEGFTSLSQSLPPDQMGSLLNEYLDNMCELITEHGATIDKIIGDAVVCFFGAPEIDDNQAANAVKLALAIDAYCEGFRKTLNDRGIPLGVTRIGLHMGDAVIGNFGGKRFFDYTGIGDTVNIAARLEGANRHLGTRICVSAAIVDECDNSLFRPLGNLVLKGRDSAIACFEPCSKDTMNSPWMKKYLGAFQLLSVADPGATNAFAEVASLNTGDGPTRFHLERLRNGAVDTQVTMWEK
ncbi:MAG: adenylate/guanylate cyclase domain-containing protein [Rhizobiaceae bacterium]|nr:adenylate/guanylate cyclase domain-containing protein [Rhizobiaceae bacterium]